MNNTERKWIKRIYLAGLILVIGAIFYREVFLSAGGWGYTEDQEYGSFSPYAVESFDGKLVAKQKVEKLVQSADVGIYCYRYQDGTWVRDILNTERPDYIVSRWEAQKAKEAASNAQ